MITLHDALKNYCTEHNTQMPNVKNCSVMGKRILDEIKKGGTFIPIEKVPQTILVNSYPDEVAPIINEVVESFFADPRKFLKKPSAQNLTVLKYMNFDIKEADIEVFETTLKSSNIEVAQNFILKGKAQYKIPFINPVDLIKLGMKFQSKWIYAKKQENIKKYQEAQAALKIQPVPEPEPEPEKKVVKRKRKVLTKEQSN